MASRACLPACHPRDRQRTPYRSAEDAVRCLVSDRRRILWVTYPSQPPPLLPPPPPCRLQFTVDFIRSTRVTRAPPTQKSRGGGGSLCDLSRAQVRPPSDPISLNPGCLSSLGEWGRVSARRRGGWRPVEKSNQLNARPQIGVTIMRINRDTLTNGALR